MNSLKIVLSTLFILTITANNVLANSPYLIRTDATAAVESLLNNAKEHYEKEQFEQAAAVLERALRIKAKHPILWHNLAGVRLAQEDWERAASLASKSNAIAAKSGKLRKLRIRNWVIITLACEGMKDQECAREARNQAQALVQSN
ncbi:hypothetical protein QUF74_17185 [Candidatus Halobeggiatoa sp. HSG11]|nr:hypothetical protein [Candidatus Halobeggiatoa sp. HSG11]